MNNLEIAQLAAKVLSKKKALDIALIDVREKSSFADYLLIASGGSERQVATLASEVEDELAKVDILAKNIEGKGPSGWILLDFGDLIVNVFSREQRAHYNIEKVWGDGIFLEIEEDQE